MLFNITWEATSFANSNSILDAELSEYSMSTYPKVCKAEGKLPEGVQTIIKGYITADDHQDDESDIHAFVSITLQYEAPSLEAAEKLKPPTEFLSKIAETLGTDSSGDLQLDLERNSWEITDIEEAAVTSAA